MTTVRIQRWLVLAASTAVVAGCGGNGDTTTGAAPSRDSSTSQTASPTPSSTGESTPTDTVTTLPTPDPADFVTKIDNPWMPWQPGSRWVYTGSSEDGPERTVVTVTDRTKVVAGIEAVVVHDVVYRNGVLLEDTYDWYAQDREGNVWYLGEQTKEYDGKKVDTHGSWEAGVDGAVAGIAMLASPTPGDAYYQEYYKGEAEDQARVLSLNASAVVPYGRVSPLLKTRDFTQLEPAAAEHKYYAKGVGVVLEASLHDKHRTQLVTMTTKK